MTMSSTANHTDPTRKLLLFDCDSTLSAIEGIDEMARLRDTGTFNRVQELTTQAMDGLVPVQKIFRQRLELVRPTLAECDAIGQLYIENVEPFAKETITHLKQKGWTPIIVSAGFFPALKPLATYLGIGRIEAVQLDFDSDGNYLGCDEHFPSTRSRGKAEIVRKMKEESPPRHIVFVGDGITDLETREEVDLFIGFGRYKKRPVVCEQADFFITTLEELPKILSARFVETV